MRHAEDKVRSEEERRSRHPERKNAEKLERAKRRCEQIRQIIASMDPANLNTSGETPVNAGASSSNIDASMSVLHPSAETIQLLSNAIAGCLQPCSLINKILCDIIGMVPQPAGDLVAPPAPATGTDQQQQTEIPRQNSATTTSDLSTPVTGNQSSQEIEALFKEAAKELEKMNEIVNNGRAPMEGTSSSSMTSSMTGTTQVERIFKNITDSAMSNATLVNVGPEDYEDEPDVADGPEKSPEHDFKMVTPPKSMRSRESSIEVHDVNSMMSDDSRDWTILDAATNEQEESIAVEEEMSLMPDSRPVNPSSGAVPKGAYSPFEKPVVVEEQNESIKSVSIETQTPTSLMSIAGAAAVSQEEVHASIQQSIETAGKLNEIVKHYVASAQQSLSNIPTPEVVQVKAPEIVHPVKSAEPMQPAPERIIPITVEAPKPPAPQPQVKLPEVNYHRLEHFLPSAMPPKPVEAIRPTAPSFWDNPMNYAPKPAARQPPATAASSSSSPATATPANLIARLTQPPKWTPPKMGPAVIVYDPNPKINTAVHTMINMGFSNEGKWLIRLSFDKRIKHFLSFQAAG